MKYFNFFCLFLLKLSCIWLHVLLFITAIPFKIRREAAAFHRFWSTKLNKIYNTKSLHIAPASFRKSIHCPFAYTQEPFQENCMPQYNQVFALVNRFSTAKATMEHYRNLHLISKCDNRPQIIYCQQNSAFSNVCWHS